MPKSKPKTESYLDDKHRQQRIAGTIDKATEAIEKKAEEYCAALFGRLQHQTMENAARAELIELMVKANIREFATGGYKIKLVHSEKEKLTVKKEEE